MSDQGSLPPAGWLYAEGDPPGTQRYWDGSAWQGDPQPVPAPDPAPFPAAEPSPYTPGPGPGPFTPDPGPFSPGPGPGPGAYSPGPGAYSPGPTAYDPTQGAAPPRKKRSVWKIILGLFLGLMLLVGGCTFFVWRAVSGPIDAGNEYLAAVQAGDFDAAWALSDSSCFAGGGPEQLASFFSERPIESFSLTGTSVNSNNGRSTGTASGTVELTGGDERSVELAMSKVGDNWLVCGIDVGGPGS